MWPHPTILAQKIRNILDGVDTGSPYRQDNFGSTGFSNNGAAFEPPNSEITENHKPKSPTPEPQESQSSQTPEEQPAGDSSNHFEAPQEPSEEKQTPQTPPQESEVPQEEPKEPEYSEPQEATQEPHQKTPEEAAQEPTQETPGEPTQEPPQETPEQAPQEPHQDTPEEPEEPEPLEESETHQETTQEAPQEAPQATPQEDPMEESVPEAKEVNSDEVYEGDFEESKELQDPPGKEQSDEEKYEEEFDEENEVPPYEITSNFQAEIPVNSTKPKKIPIMNDYEEDKEFTVESSDGNLLEVKNPQLTIAAHQNGKIQLLFMPIEEATEKTFYLVVKSEEEVKQCIQLNVKYS